MRVQVLLGVPSPSYERLGTRLYAPLHIHLHVHVHLHDRMNSSRLAPAYQNINFIIEYIRVLTMYMYSTCTYICSINMSFVCTMCIQ